MPTDATEIRRAVSRVVVQEARGGASGGECGARSAVTLAVIADPRKRLPSLPNDEAIIRLVGAFAVLFGPIAQNGSLLETNDEWAVARLSMSLETLARVTDTPTVRLSAVAISSRPLPGSAIQHHAAGHDRSFLRTGQNNDPKGAMASLPAGPTLRVNSSLDRAIRKADT
jgi:hypothetical protein